MHQQDNPAVRVNGEGKGTLSSVFYRMHHHRVNIISLHKLKEVWRNLSGCLRRMGASHSSLPVEFLQVLALLLPALYVLSNRANLPEFTLISCT